MMGWLWCVAISAVLTACASVPSTSLSRSAAGGPTRVPDYDAPAAAFVEADTAVLASEFADEYAGKYVTFEALFQAKAETALLRRYGDIEPYLFRGIRAVLLVSSPTSMQQIQVNWSDADREFGRTFVGMQSLERVRIHAYVLPAGEYVTFKNGTTNAHKYADPTLWLISSESLGGELDEALIQQITDGKTTRAKILHLFGEPFSRQQSGEFDVWTYLFAGYSSLTVVFKGDQVSQHQVNRPGSR